jgi:hypothetical protein
MTYPSTVLTSSRSFMAPTPTPRAHAACPMAAVVCAVACSSSSTAPADLSDGGSQQGMADAIGGASFVDAVTGANGQEEGRPKPA